ncbi:MAG: S8 family serine peptidase [Clostridia bacterium]|nr:S8 family serine peptidase [Clostridia bacterium]
MSLSSLVAGRAVISESDIVPLAEYYGFSDAPLEVIVKYNGDILSVGRRLGVETEILSENFAIVTLRLGELSRLTEFTEIEAVEAPKILTLSYQESVRSSCVPEVQREGRYNLSGEDVAVAIIDSGIDYTHPDFIKEDGTSRILCMWDQTGDGTSPKGFTSGAEYTNEQINAAILSSDPYSVVPEVDIMGHGTAVAGIAAGNGRASDGENMGVAPKSSLIIVKLGEKGYPSFARTTELMRAVKYSLDKALEFGLPLVINISYGTNDGAHNGQSLFELYINSMAEKWKTSIVAAAGNEGSAGHHYSGRILADEVQDVEFFYSGKNNSFFLTMWKNFTDDFSVELILPSGRSTGEVSYIDRVRNFRIGGTRIVVSYGQPKFYTTFQEIFFQIDPLEGELLVGIYKVRIRSRKIVEGSYDIYLPTVEEVGADTSFVNASIDATITIPATAQNVITVGGYDSLRGIISDFSGRGYTLSVVYTKPDLVAPAVDILAPSMGGGYSLFSGTSMAAPFVSGSAALLMQWGIVQGRDPFLYGERLKAYLKKGSRRNGRTNYPNNSLGYGTLCIYDALEELWVFNGYI